MTLTSTATRAGHLRVVDAPAAGGREQEEAGVEAGELELVGDHAVPRELQHLDAHRAPAHRACAAERRLSLQVKLTGVTQNSQVDPAV